MNVIFTCGGTAGHINPAISVANLLRERKPETRILFVGAEGEMETQLVPREGYALETLKISSYSRKLSPKGLWHNLKTLNYLREARKKADRIIKEFKPDVIVGTGGYASFPLLRQGARRGIPTAVHEANAMPGLTTRMVADSASRIMVCFEESKSHYKHPERVQVVGMPVRQEFLYTTRAEARARLGLGEEPLLVSAWGSQGAREMNRIMADFLAMEVRDGCPWRHVHATGSYGWRWMPDLVAEKGVDLKAHPELDMREYIHNMPELMAAADLILSRAGASSLNEIEAAGTPCIIIPSPNVTDNHQEKNARVLERNGAALVMLEPGLTAEALYQAARELMRDAKRRSEMRAALHKMSVVDSAERIYETILELAAQKH
ncbi:MAG: UDP-N-acetylglucosamine--N-acetylmuramyl-(pentapeptide) pyrophosphoryl-undecaprenol N-acetylglucosamine transferase [Oscillospiraceae bacterium]|nr:UDP-N-acetylglucosamine--N-acetylmuramyl-(pentapeptide) pyrophosphoryl-undecaprenol N-acetylglucosamine transferase [Oscillospiraceae bacterium]MBR4192852.1 UDP-N-acetylglucosamine--N-acetylmuramyl-(pentapeptide) pyrophosphoryl-undecaprenol N-acetylglucosamine transferase [Oscillospiraceae bacterium]